MASANAQCADTDKIYIDPRLVPKRPVLDRGGFAACMNNRNPNDTMCQYLLEQTMQRNQPIVVPSGVWYGQGPRAPNQSLYSAIYSVSR